MKSQSWNRTLLWGLGELPNCCQWICPILRFSHRWPPRAPPSEPAGFPHPFLSKGCKIRAPALQGLGRINRPCLPPKTQWAYREKKKLGRNLWFVIVAAVAGPKELVAEEEEGSASSCPLLSHGWWNGVFCHLQSILRLGRAAAWRSPVGGTAIQHISRPESEAMERSSAKKETSLPQSGQHWPSSKSCKAGKLASLASWSLPRVCASSRLLSEIPE